MSSLGFVEQVLDNTNHIYQVGLKQFTWWKKVLGTDCLVSRVKQHDKYRNVYGSIANSILPDDNDSDKFPYVILINMNDMKKLFQKSTDQLQFYDNEDILKLGDILIFSRLHQEYKWKIVDILTFSETNNVLRQYTITGLAETNSDR
jgi:hypothetical protein